MNPVGRGVWVAPWVGPNEEVVLIALDARRRLIGTPVMVPHGASRVVASDELWEQLERENPVPMLKLI